MCIEYREADSQIYTLSTHKGLGVHDENQHEKGRSLTAQIELGHAQASV